MTAAILEALADEWLPAQAVDGDCLWASGTVRMALAVAGIDSSVAWLFAYRKFPKVSATDRVLVLGHMVTVTADGLVVDATATQFDSSWPSLIVEPVDVYLARFQELLGDDAVIEFDIEEQP